MSMIKIGMIGIAAVFLALLLKKEKGELALLVGIAASVLIFGYTLSRISFILDFLRELMDTLPVDRSQGLEPSLRTLPELWLEL